ncbi:hypothetical protein GIB67_011642 [Kingdonia uniflora]|uniref:Purine permease n=1 Tax=Kingdonia uniflora TaxID=39325 RepID=A0A7J7NM28_9MAGN|nr:hypothetical protein GIB67_011642 [Kingdonia uniflora]
MGNLKVPLDKPSIAKLSLIYNSLGLVIAGDNMMYSVELLYLPVSTYSLLCGTQLAFNAVFSFFINSQKFTTLIFNFVAILTLYGTLIAVNTDSTEQSGVSNGKYVIGFICTLGASATYSLILSLMQLSFQRVLKTNSFLVVLDMQIYTSLVAACASTVGLFAICSVGVVGLIFVVSSFFFNVISTMSLPLVPIVVMIIFHEKMNGMMVVAMLMALWGFSSYLYQHYLDDLKQKETATSKFGVPVSSTSCDIGCLVLNRPELRTCYSVIMGTYILPFSIVPYTCLH